MSEDIIRYDILAQEALRGVIRKVLDEVSRAGLPGDHHFFITFETGYPGVRLSKRMMERYPEEMTIVIQHSFWNLDVGENAFEIDLSFDDIRERLRVPFGAIRGFFDPSVKFGLQFDVAPTAGEAAAQSDGKAGRAAKSETRRAGAGSVPAVKPAKAPSARQDKDKDKDREKAGTRNAGKEGKEETGGAEVVSLDTFRKKK